MTYIVPNYFLQEHPEMVIGSDSLFAVAYSSREAGENIEVRNTMHAMIMVLEGGKKLSFGTENIAISSGDIFLLLQGNYFMSDILSDLGRYGAVLVYFDDSFVLDFVKRYNLDLENSSKKPVVTFAAGSLLKELLESYVSYQNMGRRNELLRLKTEEVFLHLLSSDEHNFISFLKAVRDSSDQRLTHILESNLDLIQTVDDMCKIARVSESRLRIETRRLSELSPKKWLDLKRLEQASVLLRHSDRTVSQIAVACGYSTSSWFGVQFKKHFGLSPKVYREQNR